MQKILIIGAGRSATSLIQYMLDNAATYNWQITVADMSLELANKKINGNPRGTAVEFNVMDTEHRISLIKDADMVVSMLPAFLHIHVAKDCLAIGKNLATASYVSDELKALDAEVKAKGLIFLGEIGLDPGIDHMSAMQLIDTIRDKGGDIKSFRSYAGGLVAPESDDNPWHYKFTWNPRNVVLAGQGIAKYLYNGRYRHVPYHRLFSHVRSIDVPTMGEYEAYPNRASLKYIEAYGLEGIPTILRATLRHKGFCKAWNLLVQLGLTDDSYKMEYIEELTYKQWVRSYLPPSLEVKSETHSIREQLALLFELDKNDEALNQLAWLGLFENKLIPIDDVSPAEILQHLLEQKWQLQPEDKDMIIMQHEIEFELEGQLHKHTSTLVQKGKDASDTAMSYLVGLPLAIGVKNIVLGNINLKGVCIPIHQEIYNPVMEELATLGVEFKEQEVEV